jgi:TetR/AcrR family transcriptional repressor of nem operon
VALEAALQLFWRRGFEATSLDDLTRAMGIGKGSFYATFGGKAPLYLRALDRYRARQAAALVEALAAAGPVLPVVRRLLLAVVDEAVHGGAGPDARRGCFLVNATTERAGCDPEVARRAAEQSAAMEAALAVALARAQRAGEVRADHDPRALARFVLTTVRGLRVSGATTPDRAALTDAAEVALAALS